MTEQKKETTVNPTGRQNHKFLPVQAFWLLYALVLGDDGVTVDHVPPNVLEALAADGYLIVESDGRINLTSAGRELMDAETQAIFAAAEIWFDGYGKKTRKKKSAQGKKG